MGNSIRKWIKNGMVICAFSVLFTMHAVTSESIRIDAQEEVKTTENDVFTGEVLTVVTTRDNTGKIIKKYKQDGTLKYEDIYTDDMDTPSEKKVYISKDEVHIYADSTKKIERYQNNLLVARDTITKSSDGKHEEVSSTDFYEMGQKMKTYTYEHFPNNPFVVREAIIYDYTMNQKREETYQNTYDESTKSVLHQLMDQENKDLDGSLISALSYYYENGKVRGEAKRECGNLVKCDYLFEKFNSTYYDENGKLTSTITERYDKEQKQTYIDYYTYDESEKGIKTRTEIKKTFVQTILHLPNRVNQWSRNNYISDVWEYYEDGSNKNHYYYVAMNQKHTVGDDEKVHTYLSQIDSYDTHGQVKSVVFDIHTPTETNQITKNEKGQIIKQEIYEKQEDNVNLLEERYFYPESGNVKMVVKFAPEESDKEYNYMEKYREDGKIEEIRQKQFSIDGLYTDTIIYSYIYNEENQLEKCEVESVNAGRVETISFT